MKMKKEAEDMHEASKNKSLSLDERLRLSDAAYKKMAEFTHESMISYFIVLHSSLRYRAPNKGRQNITIERGSFLLFVLGQQADAERITREALIETVMEDYLTRAERLWNCTGDALRTKMRNFIDRHRIMSSDGKFS